MSEQPQFLWVEKYRPATIDECILPGDIKDIFKGILAKGEIPTMLLCGPPGTGKTTVAKALCNQLGVNCLVVNGSMDGNIDTLRTTIKTFASSVSFYDGRKMVILDEADYLNPQSTQPALRGFVEEFSSNCGFILTCNFKNKIIEPIWSRCSVVDFRVSKKDKKEMIEGFFNRVLHILDSEGVTYKKKVVVELVLKHYPDFRRTINELQKFASATGEINEGILARVSDIEIDSLVKAMKSKTYPDIRSWVVANLDNDPTKIYRKVYDALNVALKPQSVPQAVLIIADWSYKNAFSADPEICLLACLTDLLVNCEFV
jgi:DNA polymerase III delta prime subunit